MHTALLHNNYVIKPQGLSIAGKFRAYDPHNEAVLFSDQKTRWSAPFSTIRVCTDDKRKQELLLIQDSKHHENAYFYDVTDSVSGEQVGVVGVDWTNFFEDAWQIMDAQGTVIGHVRETGTGRAILHGLTDGLVTQNLNIIVGETVVAELRQKNAMIGHVLRVDFNMDGGKLDRRLGLAIAFIVAGHQGSE
jgi:hypothetical protein